MSLLNLKKGESVSFNEGLKEVRIGANWEEAGAGAGSLLGMAKALFSSSPSTDEIDVDLSVVIVHKDGTQAELVYYGHELDSNGFVKHFGDNLTGADVPGQKDDEDISVDLTRVPANVEKLQVIINIYGCYNRNQHFGMIRNANAAIYNNLTGEALATFDLTDDYSKLTGVLLGEIVKVNGVWKFVASGKGYQVGSVTELVKAVK